MRVRLPPVPLIGLCSSWRPVKPSSQNKRGGRREVQFLHNPLKARSSIGSGHQPLKLEGRVRFPHGSLMAKWCNWRAPTEGWSARRSERRAFMAWEFESPLGHFNLTQASQCSAEFHKLSPSGATPEPATCSTTKSTAGYENWQSDERPSRRAGTVPGAS